MSIKARPTKEGYLTKYRNILLGWSKRYFKLERSYLHYFEGPYAPKPVDSITRGEIADVKESVHFEGKPNVFELHTKSGLIWYIQAESAEDMVAWMAVLLPNRVFTSPSKENVTPSGFVADNEPSCHPSQNTGNQPTWLPGSQGPYNTSPMNTQQGQVVPHFDPRMFAAGGPLFDPRVHGLPYTPPPPYTENSQQAQPLPSKPEL